MKARRNRDQLVIVSKCSHPAPFAGERVSAAAIRQDIETSRKKLGTDFIDIYLLHRDDETAEVRPIVDAMNELHDAGKIGAFGASNWTHTRIQEANDYAASQGLIPFTVSSPNFSLAAQHADPYAGSVTVSGPESVDARALYREEQMSVIAWAGLAGGFLSGKLKSSDPEGGGKLLPFVYRKAFATPDNFERLRRVEALAQEKGASVSQIALAWTLHHGLDVYNVVTAGTGTRMRQNIAALHIDLTADEVAHLDLKES